MFNRRELTLLRAMYQCTTVTAAAEAVHMSQPAASALLRDMEARVGFAMFRRDNRRLHLTSHGRAMIPEVLHALAGMEAVDRLASQIRDGVNDRLVIGAVAVASSMLLPTALVEVRAGCPDVKFSVRTGSGLEIVEMAVDHRIDIGVVIGSSAPDDRIRKEPIAPVSLHAILRADHPLARTRSLGLETVAAAGLIVLSTSLPAGEATRQALEQQGLVYEPVMEVGQSFTACEMAGQGLGIAIVETLGARYAERLGLVAKRLLTIEDMAISLVAPRDRPLHGAGLVLKHAFMRSMCG
ncbi:LysR family transcriptional regulator [Xylophilus sp. Kf1]|nr:LysR family transcriptional regulator [Xylophilus sp. Kf1]